MASNKLTPQEREAIEAAIAEGRLTRVEPRQGTESETVNIAPMGRREVSTRLPRPLANIPREMSVKSALEWAFGTERASFDYDEIGASSGRQRRGIGMEAILAERRLLGTSIDASPGRSYPAEDAEIIASVVRGTLPWHASCKIADLARAGRTPDWMRDRIPKLQPADWVWGRGGHRGRTADSLCLGVYDDPNDPLEPVGWSHVRRRNRKGRIVDEVALFTPCVWTPSASQIAAARRDYLDWYGWLVQVQCALKHTRLRKFTINDRLPPMTPWRVERDR